MRGVWGGIKSLGLRSIRGRKEGCRGWNKGVGVEEYKGKKRGVSGVE